MIAGVILTSTQFKQESESGCQENQRQIIDSMEDLLIASESSSKDIQHEIDIKNEYETENRMENHDIIGLPSGCDTPENKMLDSEIVYGTAITSNIDRYDSQNELVVKNDAKEVVDDNEEKEVVDNDDDSKAFEEVADKEDTAVEDGDVNRLQNDDVIDEDKDKDENEDEDEDKDDSNDDKSEENDESDDDDHENIENKNDDNDDDDNNNDNGNYDNGGKEEEMSSHIEEDSSCRINISALKVMRNILLHLLPAMFYASPSRRKCKDLKNCLVHLLVVMQR